MPIWRKLLKWFDEPFYNDEQIVALELKELTVYDKDFLRDTPIETLHLTYGMYLRNKYRMWDENNPYLKGCHPDEYSQRVIKALKGRLDYGG